MKFEKSSTREEPFGVRFRLFRTSPPRAAEQKSAVWVALKPLRLLDSEVKQGGTAGKSSPLNREGLFLYLKTGGFGNEKIDWL